MGKTEEQPPSGKDHAKSIRECFSFDEHELNPTPNGWLVKLYLIVIGSRYSMPVYMRLSQFFFLKGCNTKSRVRRKIYNIISAYIRRKNVTKNNFEHGANPRLFAGVVFHHSGVCITSDTVIESGVHLYRNVTFGQKEDEAPHIKKNARIASHAVVLGGVTVGESAIVAPGAVVVKDVPDFKVVAGVPAEIIGDVTPDNLRF